MSTIPSYILILTPVREHIEAALLKHWHKIVPPCATTSFTDDIGRNLIRTALVVGTAVIATRDPNFGSTLGAVGGLTDAFQAFIVPIIILFYIRISTLPKDSSNSSRLQSLPWTERFFYCTVCGWGISIICYTFTGVLLSEPVDILYFGTILVVSTLMLIFMYEIIVLRLVCMSGRHHQQSHHHQQSSKILSSHISGDFNMSDLNPAASTTDTINCDSSSKIQTA